MIKRSRKRETMKTIKNNLKTRKTRLAKGLSIFLKNNNPDDINELSQQIKTDLTNLDQSLVSSYSPSINKALVSLKSISRQPISNCNAEKAFSLKNKEPLEISVNNKCYSYSSQTAKEVLLKNLSANKHIDPKNIITPIQSLGNCWFNTMFVTLFVSDKGRKFFHFFRQLMIKGKKADGKSISKDLRNGFALLNYAIDACLQGNQFAYKMDTNTIIKDIYKNIPTQFKDKLSYITNIKEAGNPIRYYGSLMFYLQEKSIQLMFVEACNKTWKEQLLNKLKKDNQAPNPQVIVLEFFDDASKVVTNKPTQFSLANGTRYALDSCVVRNTMGHHFCSLLTCEQKEYAYDGMSFHRLVPLAWKKQINKDFTWQFEGSTDADDKLLEWDFRSGYQMLVYYRV
jgi:hypothetical protein